jgi:hypothetical protein
MTVQFSEPDEPNITYLVISFQPEEHQLIPHSRRGETAFMNCLIVDFDTQTELAAEKPFPVVPPTIAQNQQERRTELSSSVRRLEVDPLLSGIISLAARVVETGSCCSVLFTFRRQRA